MKTQIKKQYISHYNSPFGGILLAADESGLTGLWFEGQKYFACGLGEEQEEREIPVFKTVKYWLDLYFDGKEPDIAVPLHFIGTDFQKKVWGILCSIPYGETVTYGEIASRLVSEGKCSCMSARAVGGAVGRNKISILVPCHRVVGQNGNLTGYAGGMDRKAGLLELERGKIPDRGEMWHAAEEYSRGEK